MKKQDLEKKVKGLEGLVESQRNTIAELVERNRKLNGDLKPKSDLKEYKISAGVYDFFITKYYTDENLKLIMDLLESLNEHAKENFYVYERVLPEDVDEEEVEDDE